MIEGPERRRQLQHDLDEMERLIGELLEAERLNTDHAPLNLQAVPLAELVTELVREHFQNRHVDVDLPGDPLTTTVDPVRVKLMLRNLLDNALRHNRETIGPVTLSCRALPGEVEIVVSDHGEGFSETELSRAGEAFWRRDRARTRSAGGFGLGLYLSRRIALAHGGRFDIDSRQGQWTRVSIGLPRDARGDTTR